MKTSIFKSEVILIIGNPELFNVEKDNADVPFKREENSSAMHQNQIMKSELKVEVKEELLKDLHMVHDNSKQNAKMTKDEENEEKLKIKEESNFVEMGIDFVTSKTFDKDYLKTAKIVGKGQFISKANFKVFI